MAIHLGRPSPDASRDRPERRRRGPPGGTGKADAACRSYLVLLPVGFALPPPLPAARCALTAPFHPCRPCHPTKGLMGSAVCFLWHFPWGRPRRALPGTVPPWSPDFPPLAKAAWPGRRAAIRPSGMGSCGIARPRCQTHAEPKPLRVATIRRTLPRAEHRSRQRSCRPGGWSNRGAELQCLSSSQDWRDRRCGHHGKPW
jgi:hypothetical protein